MYVKYIIVLKFLATQICIASFSCCRYECWFVHRFSDRSILLIQALAGKHTRNWNECVIAQFLPFLAFASRWHLFLYLLDSNNRCWFLWVICCLHRNRFAFLSHQKHARHSAWFTRYISVRNGTVAVWKVSKSIPLTMHTTLINYSKLASFTHHNKWAMTLWLKRNLVELTVHNSWCVIIFAPAHSCACKLPWRELQALCVFF